MIYAIPLILLAAQAVTPPPACDAALAARFTPARPVLGHYELCTIPAPLDTVLAGARAAGQHVSAVDALDPLDAFGTAGTYDRSLVSRLYGGRRAAVAHGWSLDGRTLVSDTYVSPYPNQRFTALEPGTLVIHFVLETRGL
jgi:hypothetical protein